MSDSFSDDELLAWLDEQLPLERLSVLEQALRESEPLRQRLAGLIRRRDSGVHSVGEIWRRNQLSCPSRETLGSWLLGAIDDEIGNYVEFHLQTISCRLCNAVLEELQESQAAGESDQSQRRRRFFESSAGLLRDE